MLYCLTTFKLAVEREKKKISKYTNTNYLIINYVKMAHLSLMKALFYRWPENYKQ